MHDAALQGLAQQGDVARGGDRRTGNHLDRILACKDFQADARLLAGDECELSSASLAFAELAARMAAANAGAYAYARSEVLDDVLGPPPDTYKQPSGEDALAELRRMPPFLRHFLWRFVALVYRPPLKRGERAPTLSKAANDDAARAQRALALLPVMGIVLGAQPQSDLAALSTWHRRFAVMVLLTDGGVSEKLFNMIRSELNLTSARTARRAIGA